MELLHASAKRDRGMLSKLTQDLEDAAVMARQEDEAFFCYPMHVPSWRKYREQQSTLNMLAPSSSSLCTSKVAAEAAASAQTLSPADNEFRTALALTVADVMDMDRLDAVLSEPATTAATIQREAQRIGRRGGPVPDEARCPAELCRYLWYHTLTASDHFTAQACARTLVSLIAPSVNPVAYIGAPAGRTVLGHSHPLAALGGTPQRGLAEWVPSEVDWVHALWALGGRRRLLGACMQQGESGAQVMLNGENADKTHLVPPAMPAEHDAGSGAGDAGTTAAAAAGGGTAEAEAAPARAPGEDEDIANEPDILRDAVLTSLATAAGFAVKYNHSYHRRLRAVLAGGSDAGEADALAIDDEDAELHEASASPDTHVHVVHVRACRQALPLLARALAVAVTACADHFSVAGLEVILASTCRLLADPIVLSPDVHSALSDVVLAVSGTLLRWSNATADVEGANEAGAASGADEAAEGAAASEPSPETAAALLVLRRELISEEAIASFGIPEKEAPSPAGWIDRCVQRLLNIFCTGWPGRRALLAQIAPSAMLGSMQRSPVHTPSRGRPAAHPGPGGRQQYMHSGYPGDEDISLDDYGTELMQRKERAHGTTIQLFGEHDEHFKEAVICKFIAKGGVMTANDGEVPAAEDVMQLFFPLSQETRFENLQRFLCRVAPSAEQRARALSDEATAADIPPLIPPALDIPWADDPFSHPFIGNLVSILSRLPGSLPTDPRAAWLFRRRLAFASLVCILEGGDNNARRTHRSEQRQAAVLAARQQLTTLIEDLKREAEAHLHQQGTLISSGMSRHPSPHWSISSRAERSARRFGRQAALNDPVERVLREAASSLVPAIPSDVSEVPRLTPKELFAKACLIPVSSPPAPAWQTATPESLRLPHIRRTTTLFVLLDMCMSACWRPVATPRATAPPGRNSPFAGPVVAEAKAPSAALFTRLQPMVESWRALFSAQFDIPSQRARNILGSMIKRMAQLTRAKK